MFRSAHMSTLLLAMALLGLISQGPTISGNGTTQITFVLTTTTTAQTISETVYVTTAGTITETAATTVDKTIVSTVTPTVTATVPVTVTQTNTPIFEKSPTDWSTDDYMFLSALGLTVMVGFVLGYFLTSRKARPSQYTNVIVQGAQHSFGVASDVGSRAENQDSVAIDYTIKSGALSRHAYTVVVADGVSGEAQGKIASSLAVNSILRSARDSDSSDVEALRKAFHEANRAILDYSVSRLQSLRLATTAVAAVVDREGASIANVGDSRGYMFRGGKLFLLTKDHTVTQQLFDGGKITEAQALNHQDRHKLTKALGQKPALEPEVSAYEVARGDVILLCTDGLTDGLTDSQMASIIQGKHDMRVLSKTLVQYAKSAGVQDNITVALVRVD